MRKLTGLLGAGLIILACAVGAAQAQPSQVSYLTQRDATGNALNFCDVQGAGLPQTIHLPCHALGFINASGQVVVAGPANPFPVVDAQLHTDLQALTTAMQTPAAGTASSALQTSVGATAHADALAQASATAATTAAVSAGMTQAHTDAGALATSAAQAQQLTAEQATAAKLAAGGIGVVQPDALASGALAAATLNNTYVIPLAGGEGTVGFNVSGLSASGATLAVEAQNNGSAWYPVNTVQPGSGALAQTITADGNYRVNAAGHTAIRLRVSTAAGTPASIAVASIASSGTGLVALSAPLPGGSANIGKTTADAPNWSAIPETPLAGTFTTSTAAGTCSAAFPAQGGMPVNFAAWGASTAPGASLGGTVYLVRSIDGGAVYLPITAAGTQLYTETSVASEDLSAEPASTLYEVCAGTVPTSTINYRVR